jgi:hypothetical protein
VVVTFVSVRAALGGVGNSGAARMGR